jgi:hypothetical protein
MGVTIRLSRLPADGGGGFEVSSPSGLQKLGRL